MTWYTTLLMTSLSPGQRPPQDTIPTVVVAGLKCSICRKGGVSRLTKKKPRLHAEVLHEHTFTAAPPPSPSFRVDTQVPTASQPARLQAPTVPSNFSPAPGSAKRGCLPASPPGGVNPGPLVSHWCFIRAKKKGKTDPPRGSLKLSLQEFATPPQACSKEPGVRV